MLWYEQKNIGSAVSTRVRLARNVKEIPFPSRLDGERFKQICRTIRDAVLSCDFGDIKLREIDMDSLGEVEANSMVERHVISMQFASGRDGRILLLSDDETVSIMIGEEDHLRIQVILPGLQLEKTYEICDMIDSKIGQKLEFAYLDNLGFLTECPTNLGTGMRASVMLHLPVLESTGKLKNIALAAGKIGLTFRGFYGEGSEAKASLYQLSNQITLGVSEKGALENLKNIAESIVTAEQDEVNILDKTALKDMVMRSFGLLKYAEILSSEEMMKHISYLMLGERAKILSLPENISLINIFITTQPTMIRRTNGELKPNERDILRAKSIREILSNVDVK